MSRNSRNQFGFVVFEEVVVVVVVEVGNSVDVVSTVELGSQSGSFAGLVLVLVVGSATVVVGSPSIVCVVVGK